VDEQIAALTASGMQSRVRAELAVTHFVALDSLRTVDETGAHNPDELADLEDAPANHSSDLSRFALPPADGIAPAVTSLLGA
jgi:hypothetical protein